MFGSIGNIKSAGSDDTRNAKLAELKKTQQMFFKLLTTQLKCQDIENTVDMNQMTQNIYQMNELQTLMSIDYKLDGLTGELKQKGSLASLGNMIGKFALTKGETLSIDSQSSEIPISYIVDAKGKNSNATVKLLDQKGQLVHEAQIENIQSDAMENFVFKVRDQNGQLTIPEGTYRVQFLASNSDKQAVRAETFISNRIQQALVDGSFVMSNGQKITLKDIFALQETPSVAKLDYNPFVTGDANLKQSITDLMKLGNKNTKA